jgi:hypothetical protein
MAVSKTARLRCCVRREREKGEKKKVIIKTGGDGEKKTEGDYGINAPDEGNLYGMRV